MADRCAHCRGPMPLVARRDSLTCSGICRVAKHRAEKNDGALGELRSRPRWVRWRWWWAGQGKRTRRPMTVDGHVASSTDPETWSRYQTARRSTYGEGVGFVLNGDGVVCIDIDDCVTDGVPDLWAADVLEALPDTYIEVSPSGRGLHVWGRGDLPQGRVVKVPGGKLECYGNGRFITVTERPYGEHRRLADLSGFLRSLRI